MEDITADSQYDAVRAILGGTARMPMKREIEELINECEWKVEVLNGVKGMLVTGPNGNSVFLPAAGTKFERDLAYPGEFGSYWSSTPAIEDDLENVGAYTMDFYTMSYEYSLW